MDLADDPVALGPDPQRVRTGAVDDAVGGQLRHRAQESRPSSAQRAAAGEVIGQALAESDHLPDLKTQVIGELWLRDLELTAWRVLHADRRWDDPDGRQAFLAAWTGT
ncbi:MULTISPECIES: hypothetical protein [Streptomyces]|uniref:hypothetical protein n=1 Tax=Streptomyces TaxID=1883 RepID=UPI001F0FD2B2|nr:MULTISPECIES: hypothetical protein [Streptomyces]